MFMESGVTDHSSSSVRRVAPKSSDLAGCQHTSNGLPDSGLDCT